MISACGDNGLSFSIDVGESLDSELLIGLIFVVINCDLSGFG